MDQTSDTSQADLDIAKAAYWKAESDLLTLANRIWVDGRTAADGLLEIAEEQGSSEAAHQILGNPEFFSPVQPTVTDSSFADVSEALEAHMERVLVAQDRLDVATAKREAVLRAKEPNRPQVVNFGGRAYAIDPKQAELRALDDANERYRLPDDALAKNAPALGKRSLTEQIAKDAGIEPVKPSPPRDKTRGR